MNAQEISRPSRVTRVAVERMGGELNVALALTPLGGGDASEAVFRGVVDLRFRGETTELSDIVTLEIEDVSSSQWESVRYRVTDVEEEFIAFYCREIETR